LGRENSLRVCVCEFFEKKKFLISEDRMCLLHQLCMLRVVMKNSIKTFCITSIFDYGFLLVLRNIIHPVAFCTFIIIIIIIMCL
jgi:hypothetical protein